MLLSPLLLRLLVEGLRVDLGLRYLDINKGHAKPGLGKRYFSNKLKATVSFDVYLVLNYLTKNTFKSFFPNPVANTKNYTCALEGI